MSTAFDTLKGALTTGAGIALITFLWYRRGQLWKFYYGLRAEAMGQAKSQAIDRIGWEDLAKKYSQEIATEHFGALAQFEIEYLQYWVNENKLKFWRSDKSGSAYPQFDKDDILVHIIKEDKTTNHPNAAKHLVAKLYYWKFFFFGAGLFLKSIWWIAFKKDRDPGFKVTVRKIPIRQLSEKLKPEMGPSSEEAHSTG